MGYSLLNIGDLNDLDSSLYQKETRISLDGTQVIVEWIGDCPEEFEELTSKQAQQYTRSSDWETAP